MLEPISRNQRQLRWPCAYRLWSVTRFTALQIQQWVVYRVDALSPSVRVQVNDTARACVLRRQKIRTRFESRDFNFRSSRCRAVARLILDHPRGVSSR